MPKAGDSSFGAALTAGVGIGLFPDVRTAIERYVQFEESITPDLENHEKYGRYFDTLPSTERSTTRWPRWKS